MSLSAAVVDVQITNVAYAVLSSPLAQTIDALRRSICALNRGKSLEGALLTSVNVSSATRMHVFRVGDCDVLDGLDLGGIEGESFVIPSRIPANF